MQLSFRLLVLLSTAEALQSVTLGRTVPSALVRMRVPHAQFGRKPPQQQPADDTQEEAMTPERRSFEAGEGNLFFQCVPRPASAESSPHQTHPPPPTVHLHTFAGPRRH